MLVLHSSVLCWHYILAYYAVTFDTSLMPGDHKHSIYVPKESTDRRKHVETAYLYNMTLQNNHLNTINHLL